MPTIYAYTKFITREVTRTLNVPDGSTELCTLDGVTYVSLPTGAVLPTTQPAEIKASITTPTITTALNDKIREASPYTKLIAQQVIDQIRAKYSVNDELYLARIGIGASSGLYVPTASELQELKDFGVLAESARQWGRDQRALLGIS